MQIPSSQTSYCDLQCPSAHMTGGKECEEIGLDDPQADQLSVSSDKFGEALTCSHPQLPSRNSILLNREISVPVLVDQPDSRVPEPSSPFALAREPPRDFVEPKPISANKSKLLEALPEDFKNLLRSVLEGQESVERALSEYKPRPDHEIPLKFVLFHFYCKDRKNTCRRRVLDALSLPYEECLAALRDPGFWTGMYMKRGSSIRISAFCLLLKKLGIPPIRDSNHEIIRTDRLTQKFLFGFLRESGLLEKFRAEVLNREELRQFFFNQFRLYFQKRITSLVLEIWRAKADPNKSPWDLNVRARMILTPIDFDAAFECLERLTL